jgi:hypothetical protein
MDGTNFILKKSGEYIRVNTCHWREEWYEKGQIFIKTYDVVI